mmetsp:Transcript_85370/g.222787  ORF Transcript_85370/g.222787 Transcript_85370/m.222787 type:complete len:213 (+) Transcript_85370:370-1008(+)
MITDGAHGVRKYSQGVRDSLRAEILCESNFLSARDVLQNVLQGRMRRRIHDARCRILAIQQDKLSFVGRRHDLGDIAMHRAHICRPIDRVSTRDVLESRKLVHVILLDLIGHIRVHRVRYQGVRARLRVVDETSTFFQHVWDQGLEKWHHVGSEGVGQDADSPLCLPRHVQQPVARQQAVRQAMVVARTLLKVVRTAQIDRKGAACTLVCRE